MTDTSTNSASALCHEYIIADIATWLWGKFHDWSGISIVVLTHLQAWMEQMRMAA